MSGVRAGVIRTHPVTIGLAQGHGAGCSMPVERFLIWRHLYPQQIKSSVNAVEKFVKRDIDYSRNHTQRACTLQ
eukprot:gene5387-biopygen4983